MPSLSLERLADDYIAHLRVEPGLSPNACSTYASWLRHYQKWLAANNHPGFL